MLHPEYQPFIFLLFDERNVRSETGPVDSVLDIFFQLEEEEEEGEEEDWNSLF